MIISVIVRTHNEERNLERFVRAYHDWVDYIFIQDDESDDRDYLLDVFSKYEKTILSFYKGERIIRRTVTRAYHHIQLNQLINLAEWVESDWIIMDDCDSIPNKHFRDDGREIIESCEKDAIYLTRINFYKDGRHFPEFSSPGGNPGYCLYAWRGDKGFKFLDNGFHGQKFNPLEDEQKCKIGPPYVTLHYPWPDDEAITMKRKRYTEIYGFEYSNFDPLNFAGKLEKPPEYAVP